MTVLRNLPNLEKLDNVPVHPEEVSILAFLISMVSTHKYRFMYNLNLVLSLQVQEAMRRGVHIPDSDDEGYPQQVTICLIILVLSIPITGLWRSDGNRYNVVI